MRPVSLPNGRIPFRESPCPGRQVGEGVSPTLDAVRNLAGFREENKIGELARIPQDQKWRPLSTHRDHAASESRFGLRAGSETGFCARLACLIRISKNIASIS